MMNSTRFKALYNNLSSIAQLVYQAVPIQGAWSHHQVMQELVRLGHNRPVNIVSGCLNTLVVSKLVMESSRGYFTRAPIRGKHDVPSLLDPLNSVLAEDEDDISIDETDIIEPVKDIMALPSTVAPIVLDPIDKLTKLSARVMVMSGQLKELANDIETAALEITSQMEDKDKQMGKMRQLQALLKELA